MNHRNAVDHPTKRRTGLFPHQRARRFLGIAAAATALAVVAGCSSGGVVVVTVTPAVSAPANPSAGTAGGVTSTSAISSNTSPNTTSPASDAPTSSAPATPTSAAATPVRVATFEGDGETYGIGIAVMTLFTVAPTDAAAFEKAAIVTVNGKPANGAWFWEDSIVPGYATEALYREKNYWPANSTIDVNLPINGLSAGAGLQYANSLTVNFAIGDAHISHVDNSQHMMTVTSNDAVVKNFPVSLGYANTPTYNGTKLVMSKGSVAPGTHTPLPNGTVEMKSDPGESSPYDLLVPWSVRITNSGEFIHAASWNGKNIGSRNTSHGCTNLNVSDAEWFYNFSLLGDVIDYPNANTKGTVQPSWDGWGWWNVPWSQWTGGGQLSAS
ncbi:MAG: L,D-transpeptidase [Nakamurella sp.]